MIYAVFIGIKGGCKLFKIIAMRINIYQKYNINNDRKRRTFFIYSIFYIFESAMTQDGEKCKFENQAWHPSCQTLSKRHKKSVLLKYLLSSVITK